VELNGPIAFSAFEEEAGRTGRYDSMVGPLHSDYGSLNQWFGKQQKPNSHVPDQLPLNRVLRRSLMRRTIFALAVCCLSGTTAFAQEVVYQSGGGYYGGEQQFMSSGAVGAPAVNYAGAIAGGCGGQLYAFDRQEPWLHGNFQRMPAYGGFSRFRPYNYRHVLAQTQIATNVWGAAHGHPYSQQFWNQYRSDYLNGNVHSQAQVSHPQTAISRASYQASATAPNVGRPARTAPTAGQANRPVHVYPSSATHR